MSRRQRDLVSYQRQRSRPKAAGIMALVSALGGEAAEVGGDVPVVGFAQDVAHAPDGIAGGGRHVAVADSGGGPPEVVGALHARDGDDGGDRHHGYVMHPIVPPDAIARRRLRSEATETLRTHG